jgi:WXG100 protein secretion system (Wss), protein YukD
MGTLLVTVVHGRRRRDLAVPSDLPVADLLAPLADALAVERASPAHELALAPVCAGSLPLDRSLVACGVGHGAVLVLVAGTGGDGPGR